MNPCWTKCSLRNMILLGNRRWSSAGGTARRSASGSGSMKISGYSSSAAGTLFQGMPRTPQHAFLVPPSMCSRPADHARLDDSSRCSNPCRPYPPVRAQIVALVPAPVHLVPCILALDIVSVVHLLTELHYLTLEVFSFPPAVRRPPIFSTLMPSVRSSTTSVDGSQEFSPATSAEDLP